MAIIRHVIDAINKDLNDKPKLLIPLLNLRDAYAEYEVLLNREKKGRKEYIYDEDKPNETMFQISELLEGIPTPDEMKEISVKCDRILNNQKELRTIIYNHYHDLLERVNLLDAEINIAVQEIGTDQISAITDEIMQWVAEAFKIMEEEMDNKFSTIYKVLKKSDNLEMKLKLSVPFIQLLGIDVETKLDVKKWAQSMYKKYEFQIFHLMQKTPVDIPPQ